MGRCDLRRPLDRLRPGAALIIEDILLALEDWPLGTAVNESEFWFPFVESVHVLAMAFLVGSVFFVDLRLLGFAGRANPVRLASRILPYTWAAFAVAVASGVVMFAPAATRYAANPAFVLKLVLIAAAGANMLAFHFGVWRSVAAWDASMPPPPAARIAGLLSMSLWIAVVICGRFVPFLT